MPLLHPGGWYSCKTSASSPTFIKFKSTNPPVHSDDRDGKLCHAMVISTFGATSEPDGADAAVLPSPPPPPSDKCDVGIPVASSSALSARRLRSDGCVQRSGVRCLSRLPGVTDASFSCNHLPTRCRLSCNPHRVWMDSPSFKTSFARGSRL